MVPYVQIPPISVGSETIYAFDILVAVAIIVGVIVADKRAHRLGLDRRLISDVALWAVVPGFILSHIVSIVFYFPERLTSEDPWLLLRLWDGMSSLGGFLGGAAGVIYFFRRRKLPLWPYSNAIVFGFTVAWIFGRAACSVAHDHPGLPTDFFLAVDYPAKGEFPAGPRHDLGWYECLWALAMSTFFFIRRNKPEFAGYHTAVFVLAYVPIRFINDFLRTADERYLGLTPAQYICLGLLPVGIWLLRSRQREGHILTPDFKVHIFADGTAARPPRGEEARAIEDSVPDDG
jgi:phosphatidylglycerol:prolipoprotein diacylglycerol transferase